MDAMLARFHRVVVPIDFGPAPSGITEGEHILWAGDRHVALAPTTRQSLALAAELAPGGQIRLVHATPNVSALAVYGGRTHDVALPVPTAGELEQRAHEISTVVLRALADELLAGMDVELEIRPGIAAQVVDDVARQMDADLLILGTSGHGRLQRIVVGSTADRIIRSAPCPVMVVPTTAAAGD